MIKPIRENMDIYCPIIKVKNGCDHHRIHNPFIYAGKDFKSAVKLDMLAHLERAKLVTFNREPGIKMSALFEAQKRFGFKTVMDMDDYWHLYPSHIIYKAWVSRNIPKLMEELFTKMDAITCTSEKLRDKIYPFNKNVYVIPNAVPLIDIPENQFVRKNYNREDYTRFGYVAGSSHLPDLKSIEGVFNHFPKLNFALAGYNNPNESKGEKNVWDKMERIASHNYHNPNYRRLGTIDIENYMNQYETLDVCIAPLEDNNFNYHKSSLKAYEAGAKKCAMICSKIPPYTDDLPEDLVYLCQRNRDWVNTIKLLRDTPDLAKTKGEELFNWVRDNRELNTINELRFDIYDNIIQQK